MTPTRIALVAHFAYGALSGQRGHIGGVERQTSLTARWLAARGHHVTLLTWDEGQPDGQVIDGVRVLKMCRRDQGLPGVRFFHPRWSQLDRALARADADVYYQNCGEYVTGQVALWCGRHARPFVYSVASDPDCDPALPLMKTMRERVLYRYGLRHADRIVVQTRQQQQMLDRGFALSSEVVPMPCPDTAQMPLRVPARTDARFNCVLWMGRICAVKRPDRLIDLARRCPDLQFEVVGPAEDSNYAASVIERARALGNITFHGAAQREEIGGWYDRVACLVCTSDIEGFPNTFLEAFSHGVPVVSTLDPDFVLSERGLGACATPEHLHTALKRFAAPSHEWYAVSRSARAYYESRHTVDAVMAEFERILVEAAHSRAPHRRQAA